MKTSEPTDSRLAYFLQQYLTTHATVGNDKLKGLRLCGSQALHQTGRQPKVFLMSNGKKSKFFGLNHCNSVWSCPICTPINMGKKAARIAGAIDALAKWLNQSACMITFTLPHMRGMTLEETFDILRESWRAFAKETSEKRMRNGYMKGANAYGRFRDQCCVEHFVRMFEITWGKKSWHPHIHALFWVPNDKFSQIADHEKDMFELWWHITRKSTKKILSKTREKTEAESMVEFLYQDEFKHCRNGHRSLFISKNADGTVKRQSSAQYLSGFNGQGWAAENELTGLHLKTAKRDHYTPYQMLTKAYEDPRYRDFWMRLYLEFAEYTNGVRRFALSRGLNKIIDAWFASNEYVETLQKKSTDKETAKPWTAICYFSEQQWSDIVFLDRYCNENIRQNLLSLALEGNPFQSIANRLRKFNIKPFPPDDEADFIATVVFNCAS